MKRINSIDAVRGLVMVIMALDHVRDLMHVDALTQSPTDLTTTTPALFLTRLITHLCAPSFVFLAGTSVFLQLKKNNDPIQTRNFLFKRGLWLVLLDCTIVTFGLFFDIGFHTILFEVIAAIGVGFIILGLLLQFPARTLGIIGVGIIFLYNLFPLIPLSEGSIMRVIASPFFAISPFSLGAGRTLLIAYPPVPWLGIMLTGFAYGKVFTLAQEQRRRILLMSAIVALFLFFGIRMLNVYGDPAGWAIQQNAINTILSFFNVSKYPPSLLFSLLTLGSMFLLLFLAERKQTLPGKFFTVYGIVPLFYFVVHFYLIHTITIIMLLLQDIGWNQMSFASGTFGRPGKTISGLSLPAVYIVWMLVLTVLYKPCQWFGRYKASHQYWWLKYL